MRINLNFYKKQKKKKMLPTSVEVMQFLLNWTEENG